MSVIVGAGKGRVAVVASALAVLAAAPAASHAATVVIGGSPFNAASCAALGASINGLEGQAASNPKAAAGLQQTAGALKTTAVAQGCFVSPA
jgi:hypothetical protein